MTFDELVAYHSRTKLGIIWGPEMNNLDTVKKQLECQDLVADKTVPTAVWLIRIGEQLFAPSVDLKTRLLSAAALCLKAANVYDYNLSLRTEPQSELLAMKDLMWLRSNANRYAFKTSQVENIFTNVLESTMPPQEAWRQVRDICGPDVFKRDKHKYPELTDNFRKNHDAAIILVGVLAKYLRTMFSVGKFHLLFEELEHVATGKLQATLALEYLRDKFPQFFLEEFKDALRDPVRQPVESAAAKV